jgi:hypothetical protein
VHAILQTVTGFFFCRLVAGVRKSFLCGDVPDFMKANGNAAVQDLRHYCPATLTPRRTGFNIAGAIAWHSPCISYIPFACIAIRDIAARQRMADTHWLASRLKW